MNEAQLFHVSKRNAFVTSVNRHCLTKSTRIAQKHWDSADII